MLNFVIDKKSSYNNLVAIDFDKTLHIEVSLEVYKELKVSTAEKLSYDLAIFWYRFIDVKLLGNHKIGTWFCKIQKV